MRLRPQWLPTRADVPGVALAATLGVASVVAIKLLPPTPWLSDVLLALLAGAFVAGSPLARALGGPSGAIADAPRWAPGLRYTGKWLLRLAIVLMGMKVQTSFFARGDLALVFGVAAAAIPSAFFVAHLLGSALGVRRPMVDLLAGGTMICGASAVNAIAPVAGARKEEQGVAIGVVFLFSVTAMLAYRAIAVAVGLDPAHAGLWSGLSVNDLSSSVAVGAQMDTLSAGGGAGAAAVAGAGGVMAAASKSARILLLAPVLVGFALVRSVAVSASSEKGGGGIKKSIVDALPGFLAGYVGLALVRFAGDRAFGGASWWTSAVMTDRMIVDVLMSTVSAAIGLHLTLRTVLAAGGRAVAVGGGTSLWMAAITLAMITAAFRDRPYVAVAIGAGALASTFVLYRTFGRRAEA